MSRGPGNFLSSIIEDILSQVAEEKEEEEEEGEKKQRLHHVVPGAA